MACDVLVCIQNGFETVVRIEWFVFSVQHRLLPARGRCFSERGLSVRHLVLIPKTSSLHPKPAAICDFLLSGAVEHRGRCVRGESN
jgi:hypothetical protein